MEIVYQNCPKVQYFGEYTSTTVVDITIVTTLTTPIVTAASFATHTTAT